MPKIGPNPPAVIKPTRKPQLDMTSNTLQKEIEEANPKLLDAARELTWNKISENCMFILSEIKDSQE